MALQALLYSADGKDRSLTRLDGLHPETLGPRQLLWVDVCDPTPAEIAAVAARLDCESRLFSLDTDRRDRPSLANFGQLFRVTAAAVELEASQSAIELGHLTLVAGPNVVVTVHDRALPFLDELREREQGESAIGALSAESFVASLLDRLLDSYFRAVEVLVHDVDRVEVALLGKRAAPQFLGRLVAVRKRLAELRRLLKVHRDIFYGMARPDFMATERPEARPHFEALDRRYERAEDEVESARDLVIGSFELLSTRAAQTMNETMQTLTFVTVLMGVLALISGVMGMNFQMAFFDTGASGFYTVVAIMAALSGVGTWLAWRRGWI
jgi:Mg2+ and Co2+ transporter CorA